MIHIPLDRFTPSEAWRAKAEAARAAVAQAADPQGRRAAIKANEQVWRDLKPELETFAGPKCWYSEIIDAGAERDVDHFRPKGRVRDDPDAMPAGYWWLAFDYFNYRLSTQKCNRPGKPTAEGPTGKHDWFPLRRPENRARDAAGNLAAEEPVLLDPVKSDDVSLLDFDERGNPKDAASLDAWQRTRVRESIRLLRLDHPLFIHKRKQVWDECAFRVRVVRSVLETVLDDPAAKDDTELQTLLRASIEHLEERLHRGAELSAVAATCLRKHGFDFALLELD